MDVDRDRIAAALDAYEVGDELGRGGWGIVLGGHHRQLDRRVAIKVIAGPLAADAGVRARFIAEARLAAGLDHPHIVRVYDYVERDDLCLIVMEYLPGGTLWERFRRSGVETNEAVAMMLAVCSALQFAHEQGVLHRDVKPENLMFSSSGTIKLTDFGIARILSAGPRSLTATGAIVGTPAYMAPERILGGEPEPASDVYSSGVVLYELLSGGMPFVGATDPMALLYMHANEPPRPLREVNPAAPLAVADVVMRALAKAPKDRYQSAEAFGLDLATGATQAWGPGWLGRTGVAVMASSELVAVTERTLDEPGWAAAATVVVSPLIQEHPRLGAAISPVPQPGPSSAPEPEPAETYVPAARKPPAQAAGEPLPSTIPSVPEAPPGRAPGQPPASRGNKLKPALWILGFAVIAAIAVVFWQTRTKSSGGPQTGASVTPSAFASNSSPKQVKGKILTWTRAASPSMKSSGPGSIEGLSAGPGQVVAAGFRSQGSNVDGTVWISTDGRRWKVATAGLGGPGDQRLSTIAISTALGGRYVTAGAETSAADTNAAVWTSSNGLLWRAVTSSALGGTGNQFIERMNPGGGGLLFAGYQTVGSKTQGVVWIFKAGAWRKMLMPGSGNSTVFRVRDFRGRLVAVGTSASSGGDTNAAVWTSMDGAHWQGVSSAALGGAGDQGLLDVVPVGNELIGAGYTQSGGHRATAVWRSSDGLTWTRPQVLHGVGDSQANRIIAGSPGLPKVIAVGQTRVNGSQDGVVWVSVGSGALVPEVTIGGAGDQIFNNVLVQGGRLIAAGSDSASGRAQAVVWIGTPGSR